MKTVIQYKESESGSELTVKSKMDQQELKINGLSPIQAVNMIRIAFLSWSNGDVPDILRMLIVATDSGYWELEFPGHTWESLSQSFELAKKTLPEIPMDHYFLQCRGKQWQNEWPAPEKSKFLFGKRKDRYYVAAPLSHIWN